MKITEEMIEAHARADAAHAGRTFDGLSVADKARFRERSKVCLAAALSAIEPAGVVKTAAPKTHVEGRDGWRITSIDILREWFGGERYARDHEYLDANYGRQAQQVVDWLLSVVPLVGPMTANLTLKQMTDDEMCDAAEANIRADYRDGVIDKKRFQMEMLIVARSRPRAKKGGEQ